MKFIHLLILTSKILPLIANSNICDLSNIGINRKTGRYGKHSAYWAQLQVGSDLARDFMVSKKYTQPVYIGIVDELYL